MDFFSVPTVTFGVLYGFFIIAHDRRRILHYNVTPPSDQRLDRAAVAGSLSLRTGDPVSHFGSRLQVRHRSVRRDSLHEHQGGSNGHWLSLAERGGRALGGQLPSRTAGSCDCHQRVASEEVALFVCRVLPPGSHALRAQEADSERAHSLLRSREGGSVASCRWSSSSLRARGLNLAAIPIPEILACRGSSPH